MTVRLSREATHLLKELRPEKLVQAETEKLLKLYITLLSAELVYCRDKKAVWIKTLIIMLFVDVNNLADNDNEKQP